MSSQQQAPLPRRADLTQAAVRRCDIVGTRNIPGGNLPRLQHLVAAPLHFAPAPSFLLTALSRGADRLAAQVALSLSIPLSVVIPLPANIYREDFTTADDLAEFDFLLALAGPHWLALDGSGADPHRAYEAAGRFVVRHSDLLIAIWDGEPAQGKNQL